MIAFCSNFAKGATKADTYSQAALTTSIALRSGRPPLCALRASHGNDLPYVANDEVVGAYGTHGTAGADAAAKATHGSYRPDPSAWPTDIDRTHAVQAATAEHPV